MIEQVKTITELNQEDKPAFVKALGGIYESSPWVPERAFALRPFADLAALTTALRSVVDAADDATKLALIRAHPDLGGKLGRQSSLTPESQREQSRLGLDALDEDEFEAFTSLNTTYRDTFGFPFILCVGLVTHRDDILTAFRTRVRHTPKEEFAEALHQIHIIAQLRIQELIDS